MDNHKVLSELYITYTNEEPQNIEELPSSGSNRRYFRLSGKQSLIGVIGTCKEENEAFLYMDAHFISKGLPVPKVLLHSEDTAFKNYPLAPGYPICRSRRDGFLKMLSGI